MKTTNETMIVRRAEDFNNTAAGGKVTTSILLNLNLDHITRTDLRLLADLNRSTQFLLQRPDLRGFVSAQLL